MKKLFSLFASKWLVIITGAFLLTMNTHATDKVIFNFQTGTNGVTNPAAWQVVNDDVMGGVSTSSWGLTNGAAVFQGEVSLANNGGFASVRSLPATLELEGGDAFVFRVRGDGRSYKFTARTDRNFDSAIYQTVFTTKKDQWEEHHLPLKEFVPSFRGRVVAGEPPLDPARVVSVGFLIADKQAGPFRLEIAWIKAETMAKR